MHTALANTTHVKSDYAANVETKRTHTATCASLERHCLEVTIVGFSPYQQVSRPRRKQRAPQKRQVAQAEMLQLGRGGVSSILDKPPKAASSAAAPSAVVASTSKASRPVTPRFVHKQVVYVFYAFHGAGFKPSARSHHVVQEDIDHFMKYGTFLHGEWFNRGERLPGGPTGDARQPLPPSLDVAPGLALQLVDAPRRPAPLPGYNRKLKNTDGCPNQYDYGTAHRQTSEWRSKTAH